MKITRLLFLLLATTTVCRALVGINIPKPGQILLPQQIKLDVVHIPKNDNYSCATTAVAMAISYYEGKLLDKEIVWKISGCSKKALWTYGNDMIGLKRVATHYGYQSEYAENLTFHDLQFLLSKGILVVLNIKYRKTGTETHAVLATGYDNSKKVFFINDSAKQKAGGEISHADLIIRWSACLSAPMGPSTRSGFIIYPKNFKTAPTQSFGFEKLLKQRRQERSKLTFDQRKKLIANGWYRPSPSQLIKNIAKQQKIPFDGVVIMLEGGRQPFKPVQWDSKNFSNDFKSLRALKSESLTDNFIWMDCASDIDWFDKQQWQNVIHNTRIIARAALIGRCAGILFDPECYGPNLWTYRNQRQRKRKTFAKFNQQLKQRGRQWIKVVQQECPGVRILTLFWSGCDYLVLDTYNATGRDTALEDTFARKLSKLPKRMENASYGLLPAFMNGMLEGIKSGSTIINGNEAAYYYEKRQDYQKYRVFAEKYLPKAFISPHLWEKYKQVVKIGACWYTDFYFANSGNAGDGFGTHMHKNEQQMWAEHNIYWATRYSDEYVWEWSEGSWERPFDWWKGHLPDGYAAALKSARNKSEKGQPLGYKSSKVFLPLFERLRKQIPKIRIVKLAVGQIPPKIDGNIDDPVWEKAYISRPFQPRLDGKSRVEAQTTALICCDSQSFYIALKCEEPTLDKMKVKCRKPDNDNILDDDSVQIAISTQPDGKYPLYFFAVNAGGTKLDYRCGDKHWYTWDASYNPIWKYAVSIKKNRWFFEAAIPWRSLHINSDSDIYLALNIFRNRAHQKEKSGWAPTVRWSFAPLEAEWFGRVTVIHGQ